MIQQLARRNGTTTALTAEDLRVAAAPYLADGDEGQAIDQRTKLTTIELIKHSFDDLKGEHVRALFSTTRLAYSTSLVIFCYAALGVSHLL